VSPRSPLLSISSRKVQTIATNSWWSPLRLAPWCVCRLTPRRAQRRSTSARWPRRTGPFFPAQVERGESTELLHYRGPTLAIRAVPCPLVLSSTCVARCSGPLADPGRVPRCSGISPGLRADEDPGGPVDPVRCLQADLPGYLEATDVSGPSVLRIDQCPFHFLSTFLATPNHRIQRLASFVRVLSCEQRGGQLYLTLQQAATARREPSRKVHFRPVFPQVRRGIARHPSSRRTLSRESQQCRA
jgi:hypothetical protein